MNGILDSVDLPGVLGQGETIVAAQAILAGSGMRCVADAGLLLEHRRLFLP